MKYARSLSLVALAVMAIHWCHPGAVIAMEDLAPQTHPGIWFAHGLSAWSDRNDYFGQIDASYAFAPFMALWWLLDRVLGASFGEVALMYVLLAAGWLGAFSFARRAGCTALAATAAAWIYALNPWTQNIFGSFAETQCAFFALLPWVGAGALAAARDPAARPRARLGLALLALCALCVLGITPQLVFQFVVCGIVLAAFAALLAEDVRAFARWAAGTALVMIGASLWWAIPDVLSFAGVVIPHPVSLSGNAWTYVRSSLLNNERFLYIWGWRYAEYFPGAHAYDGNPIVYASGFLAFASGLAGLIVLRGRALAAARFAVGCALVVMFLSKGAHPPLVALSALLWKIPGTFFFDDPAGIVMLAILLLSATGAAAFDALLARPWPRGAGLGAVVVASSLSAILLVTGAVFHGAVDAPDGFHAPSVYVRIPPSWNALAAYLNDDAPPGGALMLPPILTPGYDVAYRWGYYGVDLPPGLIARRQLFLDAGLLRGLGYLKHRDAQRVADRVHALLDAQSPQVVPLLRSLGIRYVVFRGDVYNPNARWLTDRQVALMLRRAPQRFGRLSLYDLGPIRAAPAATGQRYDPSWVGFAIGPGVRVVPHVRVDGWRNGWETTGTGDALVALNLAAIFEVVALLFALGLIGWQALRARS